MNSTTAFHDVVTSAPPNKRLRLAKERWELWYERLRENNPDIPSHNNYVNSVLQQLARLYPAKLRLEDTPFYKKLQRPANKWRQFGSFDPKPGATNDFYIDIMNELVDKAIECGFNLKYDADLKTFRSDKNLIAIGKNEFNLRNDELLPLQNRYALPLALGEKCFFPGDKEYTRQRYMVPASAEFNIFPIFLFDLPDSMPGHIFNECEVVILPEPRKSVFPTVHLKALGEHMVQVLRFKKPK